MRRQLPSHEPSWLDQVENCDPTPPVYATPCTSRLGSAAPVRCTVMLSTKVSLLQTPTWCLPLRSQSSARFREASQASYRPLSPALETDTRHLPITFDPITGPENMLTRHPGRSIAGYTDGEGVVPSARASARSERYLPLRSLLPTINTQRCTSALLPSGTPALQLDHCHLDPSFSRTCGPHTPGARVHQEVKLLPPQIPAPYPGDDNCGWKKNHMRGHTSTLVTKATTSI